jgi:UDP-glucose 4-epimerase
VRALVAGGAGFLGSHLVDRLVAAGESVDVIDDLSGGSLANLAAARAEAAAGGHELRIHTLDVRAPELVDLVGRRPPDVLYALAGAPPGAGRRALVDVAVGGLVNLLEAARTHGVPKVVVALDAMALYGDVPTREQPVKEAQAWQPRGVAGVAARAAAELLAVYRAEHAVEHTALALGWVYGPRQPPTPGTVAALLHDAAAGRTPVVAGDARTTRDLLHVDDAVDALVRAASRGSGLVVNIGSGCGVSWWEVARAAGAPEPLAGQTATGEPARFALSCVRARIHLGWEPFTPLPDGVAATREALGP